ncbi:MAG: DUF4097 family beta strand repeat-containing protein [bacterium]
MKSLKIFYTLLIFAVAFGLCSASDYQEKTKSFKVSKGGELSIKINPGDISISTWEKEEVLIKVRGVDEDEMEDVEIKQSGSKIIVSNESGWGGEVDVDVTMPVNFHVDAYTTGGDVTVKSKVIGRVNLNTSGGDITTKDVQGQLNVNTSGGDVRVGNINGELSLNTQGGDITTGNINGKNANLNTMGGDITLGRVDGDVSVNTYGGDIKSAEITGNANTTTFGGDIVLQKVSGSVNMSTYGGDLYLTGSTGKVEAETKGGDIILKDIKAAINATTYGGEIHAELFPSGKGDSRLKSHGGDIIVKLPANTGITIDATINLRGSKSDRKEHSYYSEFKDETVKKSEDKKEIHVYQKINGGGQTIRIETTNSDIRIIRIK